MGGLVMTKQEEIDILQSLKGDTYFAQFFGSKDIDQMCQNINNDFAIEGGCGFSQKAEQLQRIIDDLKKEYVNNMRNWGMKIIEAISSGTDEDEIYGIVKDELGIDEIIKFKHSKHIELNDDELNFLVSKI